MTGGTEKDTPFTHSGWYALADALFLLDFRSQTLF